MNNFSIDYKKNSSSKKLKNSFKELFFRKDTVTLKDPLKDNPFDLVNEKSVQVNTDTEDKSTQTDNLNVLSKEFENIMIYDSDDDTKVPKKINTCKDKLFSCFIKKKENYKPSDAYMESLRNAKIRENEKNTKK